MDKIRVRLPAHEIETLVEKALRNTIIKFRANADKSIFKYVLQHQDVIPTYDLVRTCVEKITVTCESMIINVNTNNFAELVKRHMNLNIATTKSRFKIQVNYQTARIRRGAIVINAEKENDIFDLAGYQLKRLVQGVIWREDHFSGKTLKEISHHSSFSDSYIRKSIMRSFDILQNA